jgi:nucleoid-associated protein YgaU
VKWQEIYEVNKDQIKNPDLIHPGWKLKIPAKK